MIDLETVLLNLVKPLCKDKESVNVKKMESLNEKETLLYVYASKEDLSKLIGRQGIMVNSIRQMLQMKSSYKDRINIKFEEI